MRTAPQRRFPIGTEVLPDGTAHARVWAPTRRRVEVVLPDAAGRAVPLTAEPTGYFSGAVPGLTPGGRYAFRLDGDDKLYPDPASRYQPEGPHGPSALVDATRFEWTDGAWPGAGGKGQVVYELHVGTFTQEGTYASAARELPALRDLGITVIELMPVAEFPGRFGWGYDGVDLWAPTRLYGTPDDLRRFVDGAHRLGLGVILDVVYNHLGPDGNYMKCFSAEYFTDRYKNEWGEAINFDGDKAKPVREFYVENAGYWIEEFHFDGLRLDATQCIYDMGTRNGSPSPPAMGSGGRSPPPPDANDKGMDKDSPGCTHVIAEIAQRVRKAARNRATYLVAENEPQETNLVRDGSKGGYGLDALWNDDFHHSALVALTGRNEAYYTDHLGKPQELISAIKWGYLYQGQWYRWQKQPRGTPAFDLPASAFVMYLENHDQVANSGRGARLSTLTVPGRLRALTALTLLAPSTPMLFQGQEFGSTRPFLYFADHNPELGKLVANGRREFLAQFPSLKDPAAQAQLDDPTSPETFARCKLDHGEREKNRHIFDLHRDLLALRRDDAAFRQQRCDLLHGSVLGERALALRYTTEGGAEDRLLLVNLGVDLPLTPIPEPLLAPPAGMRWRLHWSSEAVKYGGGGTPPLTTDDTWKLPGEAAIVLAPERLS